VVVLCYSVSNKIFVFVCGGLYRWRLEWESTNRMVCSISEFDHLLVVRIHLNMCIIKLYSIVFLFENLVIQYSGNSTRILKPDIRACLDTHS